MEHRPGKVQAGLTPGRTAKSSAIDHGRGLGLWLRRARAILVAIQRDLRDAEPGQIILCAAMGVFIGAVVDLLREGVAWLHVYDFGIPADHYLSEGIGVSRIRLLFVPLIGGLLLGLAARAVRARRFNEIVDPIEANALHGGRMSLRDSIWLTLTTVISNAAGASVGMEAGYSQLGAGLYSWAGRWFRLRRADLRIFVTAGAGAAIAAAFNAPLAGAFYGYELILGSYTTKALAPVVVATVCAALTQRGMSHMKALFDVGGSFNVSSESYFLFALLGVAAAGVSVAAMQGVTWIDRGLRASQLPDWMRPAIGGVILSGLALYAPQVLGSGHGAVQFHFDIRWTLPALAILLALKLIASAVSVGSGFRGGLFSSSLFIGALLGAVFAQSAAYFSPALESEHNVFILAGMGAVAAGIIGAPLTMVFLVLEATGDFHLRGLSIRGAHDVGWISDMNVGRLMRSDAKTVPENLGLKALRAAYPAGSTKRLYVVDGAGHYIGTVDTAELHDTEIDDALDGAVAGDLAEEPEQFLLPSENIRSALSRFDALQVETLPVLLSRSQRTVVGYMTEAYALKRYSAELERMRSDELGLRELFSIGPLPSSKTPTP
jgi:CIC family chloride channel protein